MFGFSFKERVEKIIREHFDYELGNVPVPINGICSATRGSGGNEYDAACMIMIVLMNTLYREDDLEYRRSENEEFVLKHARNVMIAGSRAAQKQDNRLMLLEVLDKFGLTQRLKEQIGVELGIESGVAPEAEEAKQEDKENFVDQTDQAYKSDHKAYRDLLAMAQHFTNQVLESTVQFYFKTEVSKILTLHQCKIISFVHLWGALDFMLFRMKIEDTVIHSNVMHQMTIHPFFDWSPKESEEIMALIGDQKEKDWIKILMRDGARSMGKLSTKDEDYDIESFDTAEAFENTEFLRYVATIILMKTE